MRIGIIGAGALGSYLGYKLNAGGHEVVLHDRMKRVKEIRRDGLRLKDVISGEIVSADLPVEEELIGDFDVLISAVRAHQLADVLTEDKAVETAEGDHEGAAGVPLFFIGSYVSGMGDWAEALGPERVLFGFPGMSAVLDKDDQGALVKFCERGEKDTEPWGITVGALRGPVPEKQTAICSGLNDSGIPVHHAESMESVFLSQAFVRLPMLAALEYAGGTLDRLSGRGDLLKLMIKAIREGLAAVKRSGLKPVPDSLEMYRWVPIFISANMIKHRLDTVPSKIGIEMFAHRAGDELRFLGGEFLEFTVASGAEFEHLEYLLGGLEEE